MKFAKVREVKTPHYAHIGDDGGVDFFIPKFDKKFAQDFKNKNIQLLSESCVKKIELDMDNKVIRLKPFGRILIPSGVKVNVPKHRALIACNKSGVVIKRGIIEAGKVIDHGYQNQLFISLINSSDETVEFKEGQKIIQYVLQVIDNYELTEVTEQELYESQSKRGLGNHGSTGEK